MTTDTLPQLTRLTRDIVVAAQTLSDQEARFLVDYYYLVQDDRKRAYAQVRSMVEEEPCSVLAWVADSSSLMEQQVKRALDRYSDSKRPGRWAKGIVGIGPVIAAGLLAYDRNPQPTAGHLWRLAGLDPTSRWNKGEKRPWNANLKTLCWKIGESFVKVSNHPKDVYGKVYQQRKLLETERNEQGLFADQAKAKLERFKIGKDTDAYASYSVGKLPPAHIHARAKRYAVKLFLSHWSHVQWECKTGEAPPLPYILSQLGHAHYLAPPGWPID